MAVKASQNPMAVQRYEPISPHGACPPASATLHMPTTMASIDHAEHVVEDRAGEDGDPLRRVGLLAVSERIRAVMPTEVAVEIVPRNRATGSMKESRRGRRPSRTAPRAKRTHPADAHRVPTTEYRRNSARSVSRPERKSRTIEAMVARPYSWPETGKCVAPRRRKRTEPRNATVRPSA